MNFRVESQMYDTFLRSIRATSTNCKMCNDVAQNYEKMNVRWTCVTCKKSSCIGYNILYNLHKLYS